MNKFKRLVAFALCLCMALTLLPVGAYAADNQMHKTDAARKETAEIQAPTTDAELSRLGEAVDLGVHFNPLYKGLIDQNSVDVERSIPNPAGQADAQATTYVTEAEAGKKLAGYMKTRNAYVELYVKSTNSDRWDAFEQIMEVAFTHTGDPHEGDTLRWQWASWSGWCTASYNNGGYEYYYQIDLTYYTTLAQENELDKAVSNLLKQLNLNGKTDYQKVCAVYDYICDNITYDYYHLEQHEQGNTYYLIFTAYAALMHKTAVCQGYALLFYRLMMELGIDARLIAGDTDGDGYSDHAWNIVKLGNVYYNLDSTWDAGMYYYNYFLRNTANFTGHTRDAMYDTTEFHMEYPMSSTDYVDGVEGVPEDGRASGQCGPNAYWKLGYDGTLTIYGTGPTYDYVDYGYDYEFSPWSPWLYETYALVVEEGITYLGEHLMCYTDYLTSITLPESLEGFGEHAFGCCYYLPSIEFPAGLKYISSATFSECYYLSEIVFNGNAPYISSDAFYDVSAYAYYPGGDNTWTSSVKQDYGGDLTWIEMAPAQPDVVFVGASLSLKGDIGLNYYAQLSERIRSDSTAYMNFTGSGADKQVAISQGVYDASDGSYRYSVALNAKNMGDNVTAQVYNAGGAVGDSKTLSIKYYADYVINNSSKATFVNLMKAMLNYGAAAQVNFGYDTSNLVNRDMSAADRKLPSNVDVSSYAHSWSGEQAGIEVTSASLLLQSETKIRIYFKVTNGKSINDFVFTVDGKEVTPVQSGSEYYIEKPNVAAKDLDTMYTFRLGNRQLTYCGLSYVNQVLQYSRDEKLINLAKSLYAYNQAANAYFGA